MRRLSEAERREAIDPQLAGTNQLSSVVGKLRRTEERGLPNERG